MDDKEKAAVLVFLGFMRSDLEKAHSAKNKTNMRNYVYGAINRLKAFEDRVLKHGGHT